MTIACFWTTETDQVDLGLRRYNGADCTVAKNGHHNAMSVLWRGTHAREPTGGRFIQEPEEFKGDPRWPALCPCGYAFTDEDRWQVWYEPIYVAAVTGAEWQLRSLPPGALFDATWLPDTYRGEDGIALAVLCPPAGEWNTWFADGPASSGGHWQRTGNPRQPETLSISPSISIRAPGTPGHYHSFLGSGGVPLGHLGDHLGG